MDNPDIYSHSHPSPATDYDPYAIYSDSEYVNRRQQSFNDIQAELENSYAEGEVFGAQDNNHQIVGKIAYLLFTLTAKMETAMWDKTEINAARQMEDETRGKAALELKSAGEIYEKMKERGAAAQNLHDYQTHLHLLRWNTAPSFVNPDTQTTRPQEIPCISNSQSHHEASRHAESQLIVVDTQDEQQHLELPSITIRQYQQSLDCQASAINFIELKVVTIIKATGGLNFWIQLPDSQRREIWKECWNQYPLYTLLRFRAVEKEVLDLAVLYVGDVNGECLKWRRYFRMLWVEMCEVVFWNRVAVRSDITVQEREEREREISEVWKEFPLTEMVFELGLGDEWSLPVEEADIAVEKLKLGSRVSKTREVAVAVQS